MLRRGGEPEESGHASATLQRRWLGLKSELKAGPDYADTGDYEVEVLTNCEAGEKVAMENYEAILKQTLPADLRSMLESQYSKIRQADERLRLLSMEYKQRESKTYFVQNQSEHDHTFTIDHVIRKEWKRIGEGGKDQAGPDVYRFAVTVKSKKTAHQEVMEERTPSAAFFA